MYWRLYPTVLGAAVVGLTKHMSSGLTCHAFRVGHFSSIERHASKLNCTVFFLRRSQHGSVFRRVPLKEEESVPLHTCCIEGVVHLGLWHLRRQCVWPIPCPMCLTLGSPPPTCNMVACRGDDDGMGAGKAFNLGVAKQLVWFCDTHANHLQQCYASKPSAKWTSWSQNPCAWTVVLADMPQPHHGGACRCGKPATCQRQKMKMRLEKRGFSFTDESRSPLSALSNDWLPRLPALRDVVRTRNATPRVQTRGSVNGLHIAASERRVCVDFTPELRDVATYDFRATVTATDGSKWFEGVAATVDLKAGWVELPATLPAPFQRDAQVWSVIQFTHRSDSRVTLSPIGVVLACVLAFRDDLDNDDFVKEEPMRMRALLDATYRREDGAPTDSFWRSMVSVTTCLFRDAQLLRSRCCNQASKVEEEEEGRYPFRLVTTTVDRHTLPFVAGALGLALTLNALKDPSLRVHQKLIQEDIRRGQAHAADTVKVGSPSHFVLLLLVALSLLVAS